MFIGAKLCKRNPTRLGQLLTASDVTGQRTFNYDANKPWRLGSTSLPAFYGSRVLTSLYEESGRVGRARGFQLGPSYGSAADLEQAYTFTAGGRFETLASKRANNSVSRTFRYGYSDPNNSALVRRLSIDGHSFEATRDYHPQRDLLSSIDSKWSGTSRTRYEYGYNGLGQRVSAKQSGDAFADFYTYPNDTAIFYRYQYSTRGELTSAIGYLGTTVSDLSRPLPMRTFGYALDNAGNRTTSNQTGIAGLQDDYTINNALNQYDLRENNVLAVSGTAAPAPGTKVVVMGSDTLAARQGRAWGDAILVNNATNPWQGTVDVYAGMTIPSELIKRIQVTAQLGAFQQSFSHDEDGNLTTDGIWTYHYDGENRLRHAVTVQAARDHGFDSLEVWYIYDYMGRRVQKRVLKTAPSPTSDTYRRYIYDGWNLVAEHDSNGSTLGAAKRSYTWGLDLAGSLTATGGVGALLQVRDEQVNKTLLPTYDGNGNVAGLLNADTGALEAAYEYSPFGELLRCEGAYAKENSFRFSTKFQDVETGLIYYGHRYYDPRNGRFINRDPIEEAGGLNLYGFAGNDPVNAVDVLGATPLDGTDPWWWWFDPWFFPFDNYFDEDAYDYGPTYGSRSPGVTAPLGPLPRMAFTSVARRGGSPTDAKRFVAPNNEELRRAKIWTSMTTEVASRYKPDKWWQSAIRLIPGNGLIVESIDREDSIIWEEVLREHGFYKEAEQLARRRIFSLPGEVFPEIIMLEIGLLMPGGKVTPAYGVGVESVGNVAYRSIAAGQVQYVGITNNLARRAAEQLAKRGIQIEKVIGGLSRVDARAVEQTLIEIHGLQKNGGTLINRINSIARTNPVYADAVRRGMEILEKAGYDGL